MKKKIKRVDPIGRAKIVEQDGTPTLVLARQWQNLIDLVTSVVSLDEEAQSAAQRIAANEAAIDDISARQVIAGDALDGGGTLGGPGDIEIDHAQSGVTPGQYGDATNVAQVTVDAYGHVTDVQNVPIAGGGGAGELDYAPPTLASLPISRVTATNFTASAADVAGKGLLLSMNPTGSGNKIIAQLKTPPAAPYTITVRLRQTPEGSGNSGEAGIMLFNSANNRSLRLFQLSTGQVFSQQWSSLENFNTTIGSGAGGDPSAYMLWLRVTVDGSGNVSFFYSYDGAYFKPVGTTTLATYVGAIDEIGVYGRAAVSGGLSGACFHYYQD